jgi:hypothetical protein
MSPQVCAHLQGTNNIRAHQLTIAVDKYVHTFYYIKEDLHKLWRLIQ